jgi:hypothetical protein
MRSAIHKQTYADGRAYRYHILDETGALRTIAEPTGLLLPTPTRLVEFFDPEHHLVGRLQPPAASPWRRGTRYEVFVGDQEEPGAVIQEQWRLVDMLLLRPPRYQVQVGEQHYVARGRRYGESYYEIFLTGEEEGNEEEVDEEGVDKEGVKEEELGEAGANEVRERARGKKVGRIQRPTAGPNYVVETDAAPLLQAPDVLIRIVLAALVVLIDMELDA